MRADERSQANWVSPKYFETLGIPIFEGRDFSLRDDVNSAPVVIINRTMARRYLGTDHAVGRRFLFSGKPYEIIGVAKDVKHGDLRAPIEPSVYFAALQNSSEIHSLELRTAVSPSAIARDIRRVVRDVDPRLRIVEAATLDHLIDQMLAREVLVADLAGFFAALTLLLVVVGVYGTVAYSVARRMKEIGIRIALGARQANITGIALRHLAWAILAGLTIGTSIAIAAGRVLAFLLFGLSGTDVGTIAGAGLIMCLPAFLAAYLPVRRAWRLDATNALRLD
jgi:hypothetical protein